MNSLLFPPRLVLRAFDDLHALAEAARRLPDVERGLSERIEDLDERMDELLDAAAPIAEAARGASGVEKALRRIDVDQVSADLSSVARATGRLPDLERSLDSVRHVEESLAAVLGIAQRLEERLPAIEQVLDSIDQLGEAAATLAAGAEPLRGAAERLGAIADRLPMPRAPRRKAPAERAGG